MLRLPAEEEGSEDCTWAMGGWGVFLTLPESGFRIQQMTNQRPS